MKSFKLATWLFQHRSVDWVQFHLDTYFSETKNNDREEENMGLHNLTNFIR